MKRVRITPESFDHWLNLRAADVTSTEISALFGVNPYMTEYELWHRKRENLIVELEPNERMTWGTRLEDAIAHGCAEDEGWKIRKMNQYIRLPEHGLGASFDYQVVGEDCVLEIKNVDGLVARDRWLFDGDHIEAPPHIEFQLQQQMLCSGRGRGRIRALIGGNKVVKIEREADPLVHDAIIARTDAFWTSVNENRPPLPDFDRDADFISGMMAFAEPGSVLDATNDEAIRVLCERYADLVSTRSQLDKDVKGMKAEILTRIGDAEKVLTNGYSISAGMVGPKLVEAYERQGYRSFRVYKKKGAK